MNHLFSARSKSRQIPGSAAATVATLGLLVLVGVSLTPRPVAGQSPGGSTATAQWERIDRAVRASIARRDLPGAVVLVQHKGKVAYLKALGSRTVEPSMEPMTEDTIFDLASLSKPIATATAIWLLIEDGKLKLHDPASKYLPMFRRKQTDGVTIERLLLHTSGMPAGTPLADFEGGRERILYNLMKVNPVTPPGTRFIYSDIGFILLGEIVAAAAGEPLETFAAKRIFEPLNMRNTSYRPESSLKPRIAPASQRNGKWIRGEVHDPRAHLMGGVAGHAGLFSTAEDLSRFADMILAEGKVNGKAFLKPQTVRDMTSCQEVAGVNGTFLRTLGWDMASPYSSNRGDWFVEGLSFGHTGFTGTSIWIDPRHQAAVIFLSNRLHPEGKGNVVRLRAEVATIAAEELGVGR